MSDFTLVVSKSNTKKVQEWDLASTALFSCIVPGIISGTVINALNKAQRLNLLRGPKVNIFVGSTVVRSGIPKRALMASTENGSDFILKNPRRAIIRLAPNSVDTHSLKLVLDALTNENGIVGNEIRPVPIGKTFIEGVYIYHTANVLGAAKHVEHILKALRTAISSTLISYQELTTILRCVPTTDPLFQHVAYDLAHHRYQKAIPDPAVFKSYLAKYENLQQALGKIDADHQTKRDERRTSDTRKDDAEREATRARENLVESLLRTAKKNNIPLTIGQIRYLLNIF